MRADGNAVVHETILSPDPSAAASAVPVEVQQMRTKGVTGVVLAVNLAYGTMWVQQADGQQFRPRYFTSDYASGSTDTGAGQMPPSYEGAIALTSYRTGEHRVGLPEPALDAECAALFQRRTGTQVVRGETAYSSTMHSCGLVRSAVTGLERAGPNLTRQAFVAGLRTRPAFTIPFVGGSARFGPAKHDAVDDVRPLEWSAGCRCWLPAGEFRRTRF